MYSSLRSRSSSSVTRSVCHGVRFTQPMLIMVRESSRDTTRPSASVTPGLQGDEYEPDSSVTEAMDHSRYLQIGRPETHTLYDPRPSDHRDTDIVLIQAEKGKSYKIEVVATGFQPKLSFYRYEGSEFLGAANECQGDQRRLCWSFTPDKDELYYAQVTNFNGGAGKPTLGYSCSPTVSLGTCPPPACSPRRFPALSPSPAPHATSTAPTTTTTTTTGDHQPWKANPRPKAPPSTAHPAATLTLSGVTR